ncbi:hypothetical protein Emed_007304 [Eimeria media]
MFLLQHGLLHHQLLLLLLLLLLLQPLLVQQGGTEGKGAVEEKGIRLGAVSARIAACGVYVHLRAWQSESQDSNLSIINLSSSSNTSSAAFAVKDTVCLRPILLLRCNSKLSLSQQRLGCLDMS